jgi:hypothetical protein
MRKIPSPYPPTRSCPAAPPSRHPSLPALPLPSLRGSLPGRLTLTAFGTANPSPFSVPCPTSNPSPFPSLPSNPRPFLSLTCNTSPFPCLSAAGRAGCRLREPPPPLRPPLPPPSASIELDPTPAPPAILPGSSLPAPSRDCRLRQRGGPQQPRAAGGVAFSSGRGCGVGVTAQPPLCAVCGCLWRLGAVTGCGRPGPAAPAGHKGCRIQFSSYCWY